jgi:hypothetical protein
MSTEQERAAALAEVLGTVEALGGRAPGARLRADDWNRLVNTLERVARLPVVTPAGAGAPAELQPGSVGFDELDADVQRLLRSGPFADPKSTGVQRELDRRLALLEGRLGALEGRLDGILAAVNRAEIEVTRGRNDLNMIDQRVAGAVTLKSEVGDLRTLVGSLRTDVGEALALRDDLAGIEVRDLADTVRDLAGFRDGWRDEADQPLTFSGLASRLDAVRSATVTDDELSSVLDTRLANFGVDTDTIRTGVFNDLQAELATSRAELRAQLLQSVADAAGSLRTELGADVASAVEARTTALSESFRGLAGEVADERLGSVGTVLRGEMTGIVDDRIAAFEPGISAAELGAVESRLSADIANLREVAATGETVNAAIGVSEARLSQRLNEIDLRIGGRFEVLTRADAELAATLRRERTEAAAIETRRLESLISEASRQEAVERSGAIDAAVGQVTADLSTRVENTRRDLLADRDAAISRALDTAVAGLQSTLESRLRVVANDAVAALEADVAAVRTDLSRLDTRVVSLDDRIVVRREDISGTVPIVREGVIGATMIERPIIPG